VIVEWMKSQRIKKNDYKNNQQIKEDIYLNELKENTYKQLNKIRKTMQDIEEELNKDMEAPPN
jgi:tRNA(Phe) wybutosine-synthesizing methylase Tyw3